MKNRWNSIKNIVYGLKGLAGIGITDIVSSGISAIFWFYMASMLGVEHYGQISYFIAAATLTSTISLTGSTNMLTVYTAKNVKIESPIYFITIIIGSIASIILFFILYNVGTSVYVIGGIIYGLANATILGKKLYKSYSKYIITQKLLMVALSIGLYYVMGSDGVLLGIASASFLYIIVIYKGFRESKLDFSLIKTRLGFMINSYMLNLSSAFSGSIDKLIIVPILGLGILGNYQLGIQFLAVLQILPSIVYKYILPQDASGNSNKNLKKATVIISIAFTIMGILLSPFVVPALFPKFTDTVQVIQIISLSLIPDTIITIYQSKYFGSERSRIVLIGSAIYITVQIITIVILGKIFGINGVAASLVLSSLATCIFYLVTNRFFEVKGRTVLS